MIKSLDLSWSIIISFLLAEGNYIPNFNSILIAKIHEYFELQSFILFAFEWKSFHKCHFFYHWLRLIWFISFSFRYTHCFLKAIWKDSLLFINGLIRFMERKKNNPKPHTKAFKQWTRHEYGIINSIRHMINGHFMVTRMTQKRSHSQFCNTLTFQKPFGNSTLANYKIHDTSSLISSVIFIVALLIYVCIYRYRTQNLHPLRDRHSLNLPSSYGSISDYYTW